MLITEDPVFTQVPMNGPELNHMRKRKNGSMDFMQIWIWKKIPRSKYLPHWDTAKFFLWKKKSFLKKPTIDSLCSDEIKRDESLMTAQYRFLFYQETWLPVYFRHMCPIFSNPITFELDRSVKMALMIRKFWIFLFTIGISQAYRMGSDEAAKLEEVRHWCQRLGHFSVGFKLVFLLEILFKVTFQGCPSRSY